LLALPDVAAGAAAGADGRDDGAGDDGDDGEDVEVVSPEDDADVDTDEYVYDVSLRPPSGLPRPSWSRGVHRPRTGAPSATADRPTKAVGTGLCWHRITPDLSVHGKGTARNMCEAVWYELSADDDDDDDDDGGGGAVDDGGGDCASSGGVDGDADAGDDDDDDDDDDNDDEDDDDDKANVAAAADAARDGRPDPVDGPEGNVVAVVSGAPAAPPSRPCAKARTRSPSHAAHRSYEVVQLAHLQRRPTIGRSPQPRHMMPGCTGTRWLQCGIIILKKTFLIINRTINKKITFFFTQSPSGGEEV
jgi:hypothetical protein